MLTKKLESFTAETDICDVFTQLTNEKRDWKPTNLPSNEPISVDTPGVYESFQRITALGLELELPVGSFIRAALEKIDDIPPTAIRGLITNIQDEENHFVAFQNIAKVCQPFGTVIKAAEFRKQLIKSKHNPLAKARDLETLIFLPIQAIMRVYGSEALERLIADISHDEYRHTNFGWELSTILKIARDKEFEQLCFEVMSWVVAPMEERLRMLWLNIFKDIQDSGYSASMDAMLNYGVHKAPFEISNSYY